MSLKLQRTLQIQQSIINRSAIETAATFGQSPDTVTDQPVIWIDGGFVLCQGAKRYPFTLSGSEATSIWHAGDMSDFTECWRLSSLTSQMTVTPHFGLLFGLPELAKELGAQLKQGRSFSLWPGSEEHTGQIHFRDKSWLTLNITTRSREQTLYIGGIPAGQLHVPNETIMAYQHLDDAELARIGIPRLSEAERLPSIWSPSVETLRDIQGGLNAQRGPYDFELSPWIPPTETLSNTLTGNTPPERIKARLQKLEQVTLLV